MPHVAPEEEVVVFGAYEGDAVSTATVAGQNEPTGTARVVVAPGPTPLYVVLSSFDSTIWRFEGDAARIAHLVLVGVRSQGSVGVASDRVTDLTQTVDSLPDARCFAPFTDIRSVEGVLARGSVERLIGRPVDVVAGAYSVGTLALPGATVQASERPPSMPSGFDPQTYELGLHFSPGGIVDIDPSEVVPTDHAESYDVLPAEMGLSQLIFSGAIETHGDYYIARPIPRFPAGLYGAHAVRFVLGRGVPVPAGDPGHSCVVSEETGLPIDSFGLCF